MNCLLVSAGESHERGTCHLSAYTTIFLMLVSAQNYCIKFETFPQGSRGSSFKLRFYSKLVTISNSIFSTDLRVSTFSRHPTRRETQRVGQGAILGGEYQLVFIALPAAAYAAVYPQQMMDSMSFCISDSLCDGDHKCCS